MKLRNFTTLYFLFAILFLCSINRSHASCSFKATFTGDTLICSGNTINYVSPTTTGHYYRWVVSGGTVVSGKGTSSLYVLWATPGVFSIKLIDSTSTCLDSLRKKITVGLSGYTLHNAGYTCLGTNASYSSGVATITTSAGNEYGAVWNNYGISLNRNFDFSFYTNQNGSADGMVFVIQNTGLKAVNTSSSQGSDMGYYAAPSGVFDQSIGVEEDIYQSSTSTYYDSSASHISLVMDKSPVPLRPQVDISSPTLGSGKNHILRVTWTRDINLFEVYMDGTKDFSWSNDIVKNVFKGNPNVWFGFTGATGGSTALQTITTDTLIYGFPLITASADTICTGDSATLTASGYMMSYLWSTGAKTRSIKVGKSGKYSVYVTDSSNCTWTVSHTIATVSRPTAAFSASNSCQGQNVPLTNSSNPSSGLSYLWKFTSKDSSNATTPTFKYNTPGTYSISLQASKGGCAAKVSKSITVYNSPIGSNLIKNTSLFKGQYNAGTASNPDLICLGDTSVYDILPPTGLSNSDYNNKWTIKSISFSTASGYSIKDTATKFPVASKNASFSFYPKSAGDSTFILKITLRTLGGNCDSVLVRSIKARPKAVSSFTYSNLCSGNRLSVTNNSTPTSGVTYLWKFGNLDSSTLKAPSYQYNISGTYNLSLQVTNGGCTNTTTQTLTVYPSPLGSNLIKGTPFNGLFSNGDNINPDYVCLNDTNTYQILAPKGFSNSDYGKKWIIKSISFATVYGTGLSDTATKFPTSTKNATFTIIPKKNGDSIYNLRIVIRSIPGNCDSMLQRVIKVRFKPVAKFGFTNACLGTGIAFKDSSTQSGLTGISNWAWNFGDGKTSNAQNPSHIYAAAGSYTVTFTPSNDGGCANTITKTVQQYPRPKAVLGLIPGCQNAAISFIDSSTIATGKISGWAWNFGDPASGTSAKSSLQNPTHVFAKSGPFNIKLSVVSALGCKDSVIKKIRVQPSPVAGFNYKNDCVGSQFYFPNNSIDSTLANNYKWDFGDGTTSTSATGVHTFTKNGTYKVKLKVTSKFGCMDSMIQTITPYAKPNVNFFFSSGCTGKTMTFADSGKNGTNALYTWTYGDGGTDQAKSITTNHSYAKSGSYNVKLVISPDAGCPDSQTRTIVISDLPKASYSAADVCIGNTSIFTNNSTSGTGVAYKWDFGDGVNGITTQSPTHKYTKVGGFKAKLTVTNASGCTDTVSHIVNVQAPPVVNHWTTSIHNSTVKFYPADTTQKSYKWLFGTGDSSSSVKPVYNYPPGPGKYYVKLFVTNKAGCSASLFDSVTIGKSGVNIGKINNNNIVVFPNPFAGQTTISYALDQKSAVSITVFDLQGRRVATVKDGNFDAGSYKDTFDAGVNNLGEGTYILKMTINGSLFTTRIVNMKP